MYEQHPQFVSPPRGTRIRRYVTLAKLVVLLESEKLFFPRADRLGDPHEGAVTRRTVELRKQAFAKEPQAFALESMISGTLAGFSHWMCISCWHMGEPESTAMWNQYGRVDDGLAIESTFERLVTAFDKTKWVVHIGAVQYANYDSAVIRENNAFGPFLHKRHEFAHEQELRAIIYRPPPDGELITAEPADHGMPVEVDLDVLIEAIRVSPSAAPWYAEAVQATVTKFGLDKSILQSNLAKSPIW